MIRLCGRQLPLQGAMPVQASCLVGLLWDEPLLMLAGAQQPSDALHPETRQAEVCQHDSTEYRSLDCIHALSLTVYE